MKKAKPASAIRNESPQLATNTEMLDWTSIADDDSEIQALVRAIKLAIGFTLLFVRCDQAAVRDAAIARVIAELSGRNVIQLTVPPGTTSLLDLLSESIAASTPDAVFVSGIEYWLPSSDSAASTPIIATLNSTRNRFPGVVKSPLVLWCPQHIIATIAHGAPDFFSVRSGVYSVVGEGSGSSFIERLRTGEDVNFDEKRARLEELLDRLSQYKSLPPNQQDELTEANLESSMGEAYRELGRYNDAEVYLRKAFATVERILGPNHPETAASLNDIAVLLCNKGDYSAAEPLYRRALSVTEKALGPEHQSTAQRLNNLANLLDQKGEYAAAEALYRRALQIIDKALGPNAPDTATALNNLANLLNSKGNYDAAEPLLRRALEIHENAYGTDHPAVATCLNNLGALLYNKGDDTAAEMVYRRALQIVEKALGPAHPNTATSLNNLAVLLDSKGDFAAAAPLYRRALEIREKTLGPNHPGTAVSLNNLALHFDDNRDYVTAAPLYRRALEIMEKAVVSDHPNMAIALDNYADLLRKLGRNTEAEDYEQRATASRAARERENVPADSE